MGRVFDAKSFRARADAKVNHNIGLKALVEARRECGNSLPLRRQHKRMEIAVAGLARGKSLGKPAGRVLGDAGIGAKAGKEDVWPYHISGLQAACAGGK
jgi:hypothetical protein